MEDLLTKEQQKEIALKRMEELDIYKPYIKEFKDKGVVTMFENFGGFWATKENGEEELENKIREFENESGDLVYAVTHEFTKFGECYSFLLISKYADDNRETELYSEDDIRYPYAWVWNKDDEFCSEYGEIGVISMGGGITRVS